MLLCGSHQGIKSISHHCLLYCAITIYRHPFVNRYLYSLSVHASNKPLQYIVIAQYNTNWCLMGLMPWQRQRRVAHALEHLHWFRWHHAFRQALTVARSLTDFNTFPIVQSMRYENGAGCWANHDFYVDKIERTTVFAYEMLMFTTLWESKRICQSEKVILIVRLWTSWKSCMTFFFFFDNNVYYLNILFSRHRSTGLPAIETITFWSVHDDVGVEWYVLSAARPTQKQYKWGVVHAV